MGYNLKTPSWDLAELQKEGIPSVAPFLGSSSSLGGGQETKGDCLVDLKLGRLSDLGDGSVNSFKNSMMESSSSGSAKRARTPGHGTQVVSCLVDGCKSDLSKCRDYHRRHKVCELHSKTAKVTIGGHEQRFCQQCSRFHSLGEFDEGKRSCRKRLDGHNRRRRKPQPEPLSITSGRFLSSHQGTRLLAFSNPQVFPASAGVTSAWAGNIKTENDAVLYNSHQQLNFMDRQNSFPESFSRSYRGKQFPFLQGPNPTLPGTSVCQPLLDPSSASGNGSGGQKMFSDGLNRVISSDRALSLLSSPPPETQEIGLSRMVQQNPIPPAQSLIPSLHYTGLSQYASSQGMGGSVGSVLVSDGSSNANLHCPAIFQLGPDGSSTNSPHQTLSFSWE